MLLLCASETLWLSVKAVIVTEHTLQFKCSLLVLCCDTLLGKESENHKHGVNITSQEACKLVWIQTNTNNIRKVYTMKSKMAMQW